MSTVPMVNPADGTSADVPLESVQIALSKGAKMAAKMVAPDGSAAYVPFESVAIARQKGAKLASEVPTQFENERNPANYDNTVGLKELGNVAMGVASVGNPLGAVQGIRRGIQEFQSLNDTGQTIAYREDQARKQAGRSLPYRAVAQLGSAAGANVSGMEQAADVGNARGVLGIAAADVAPAVVPEAARRGGPAAVELARRMAEANPPLRGALASRMAEVPIGEQFSRGEILDAAREHGVNFDVAQATDSGVAQGVKKANRYSLAAQQTYEANTTKNVNALQDWAESEAAQYAPSAAPREVVGSQIQSALKQHLETRKAMASAIFDDLDANHATSKVDVTGNLQSAAQKIVDDNAAYYREHPELKPKGAWTILEDIAKKRVAKAAQPPSGLVDASGTPLPGSPEVMSKTKSMSWSELHQLRSDLMDFYRNNPDVVKGRADAWIQQMVSHIDQAMTDAGSGLSGADLAKFREANGIWQDIKSTYDNPQSPYYHAIRSSTPSQVPGMLSKGSPELARSVRQTLGSLEGPFQRQFVEQLINDKNGNLDLGRLDSKLSRIPNDFLEQMVGADGAKNLKKLGRVSRIVMSDQNPSGTAKVGIPAGEVTGFFHNPIAGTGELASQYVAGKAMNSPRVVDYLTRPKKPR